MLLVITCLNIVLLLIVAVVFFSTVCRDLFFFLQLVLELCRGDGVSNLQIIQSQLDKIHTCSVELSSNQEMVGVFKDNSELFHHQI